MADSTYTELTQFSLDVLEGLSDVSGKKIPPKYFYDDLGSSLFEAITLLPEYGLTRADERLLRSHAEAIAGIVEECSIVVELGSGNGKKTAHILKALLPFHPELIYRPIDVSLSALRQCERELGLLCQVEAVCADWIAGIQTITSARTTSDPLIVLFLGSSIGNLDKVEIDRFLSTLESNLRPGDYFLLGADLVKGVDVMTMAYDDPTGVTSAFNLNLLGRMNRELEANFDLRSFRHQALWNAQESRIEMHLVSSKRQSVFIPPLEKRFRFEAGETIWTESSHKFNEQMLRDFAHRNGFETVATWIDREWPFAETLWRSK